MFWVAVLDVFWKAFYFKRNEAKKQQLSWSLDWMFLLPRVLSGQNSHFLFLERMWLFSYLEISKRFSYPSKATPKGDSKKTHLLEFGTFLFIPVPMQARQSWLKETSRTQQNAISQLDTGSSWNWKCFQCQELGSALPSVCGVFFLGTCHIGIFLAGSKTLLLRSMVKQPLPALTEHSVQPSSSCTWLSLICSSETSKLRGLH